MKSNYLPKKGFTLVELIITTVILAIVLTIAGTSLIFINAADRKLKLSKEVYENTRFLLERIVKEIRKETIDYEEYWNKNVLLANNYGNNFGDYAKQFIDPGKDPDTGLDDEYGTECVNIITGIGGANPEDEKNPPCPDGMTISTVSIDKNTGINPYNDNPEKNNAVCSGGECDNASLHEQKELYLIDSNGLTKTIFVRIGNGIDDDNDGNIDEEDADDTGKEHIGILKLVRSDEFQLNWDYHEDFEDNENDNNHSNDFITLTPPGIEIVDIKFYISPLEDPYKAFREESSDIQHQPHITISITATASRNRTVGIRGPAPKITLQTTITSRTYHEIKSPLL